MIFHENKTTNDISLTFILPNEKVMTKLSNIGIFRNIFEYISVNEVIYNNAVNYEDPLKIIRTILNLKIEFKFHIVTLFHDFYPICPSYTLINDKGSYCGVPEKIETCKACIKNLKLSYSGILPDTKDIIEWRNTWKKFLEKSEEIIAFSDSSKKIVLKAYPTLNKTLTVQPHNVDWEPKKVPLINNSHLHIGIIGGINYAKGANAIKDIADYIVNQKLNIHLSLVGEIYGDYYAPNLKVLGRYKKDDLPEIIEKNKINLILIPSIWPETFSYVTSEAIKMKLPLMSLNIGAHGERISKYKFGRILKSLNPEEVINEAISFFRKLN
jgi:hypothetical protein